MSASMTVITRAATLESLDLRAGYGELGPFFATPLEPTPLPEPYLVAFNPDAAALLGFDAVQGDRPEFLRLAAGNARFAAVEPFAAVYAGHQFGSFVPQLGDGRAIALGEVRTSAGEIYEWQVKGAGMTPYSRFADGRAVLRSTIREYLCSEAMAGLGIPTTRSLAIAGSDESVYRETAETAAVLTRLAPSHLRFGTFEYFHYAGRPEAVKLLADYAIARFFAHLVEAPEPERYARWLREIVERTARLIARWQAAGFAHGVMNTDNLSLLGLTLDYGPFGFLDAYEPGFICNHTDAGGRYAFDRQPEIGLWNCRALAAALSSLLPQETRDAALAAYAPAFQAEYAASLYAKFGLETRQSGDADFFTAAFELLTAGRPDYTNFFRALTWIPSDRQPPDARDRPERYGAPDERLCGLFSDPGQGRELLALYRRRLQRETRDDAGRQSAMRHASPKYVLRNYLAENAIRAARERDYGELARLHDVLRRPFDEQPEREGYAAAPPDWAHALSVSCSS